MPAANGEMAKGCLDTIAPKFYKDIILVDNSPDGFAKNLKQIEVISPDSNIGVGRSWNIGAQRVLETQADYLVILSATMRFEDGMFDLEELLKANEYKYGMETQFGWHCIAIGRECLEKIGIFDTNFFPAYYEDNDYIRRMELADIHDPMGYSTRLPKNPIEAHTMGDAHALKSGVKVNMMACFNYFVEKWGRGPDYSSKENRDKMYKHPFNDERRDLKYFPERSIQQLKAKYNLL